MRLINTETLRIEEFDGADPPEYAILSHTWGSDEISYYDFLYLSRDWEHEPVAAEVVRNFLLLKQPKKDSAGFRKILSCCKKAKCRGMQWLWIDTCCIDKSSSSELSEAINSMWKWYWNAQECYIYLSDVSNRSENDHSNDDIETKLKDARWFTRGWALQELLASAKAIFFDRHWEGIADKNAVITEISTITSIPTSYLQDRTAIRNASIAMRMSWASRRATTRVEDMAYCLLGLFDISMPLIYGEGQRAFMRLQLELLKKPQDDTIFAWKKRGMEFSGMLASWPDAFVSSGNIVHSKLADKHELGFPYSMTNLGLEMQIPISTGKASLPPAKKRNTASEQPMMKRQMAVNKKRKAAVGSSAEDQVNLPNQQALVMNRGTENAVDIMLDCGMIKTSEALETGAHEEAWQNRVVIRLKRFGSTWRRVKCDKIETVKTALSPSTEPVVPGGYTVYYIEQPGL